jgi:hypothetical protein
MAQREHQQKKTRVHTLFFTKFVFRRIILIWKLFQFNLAFTRIKRKVYHNNAIKERRKIGIVFFHTITRL